MKARYDRSLTRSEAIREGRKVARQEIERYNREELPLIKLTYAKLFILILHMNFGFGDRRIRRMLDALADATCDMHNLLIDGVFDDVYDNRLKEMGLWDAWQEFVNGQCEPLDEGSEYMKVSDGGEGK